MPDAQSISASEHFTCKVSGCRLRDALDELYRLQAVAVRFGACRCTWDIDENWDGVTGDGDKIVRHDPDCPVHRQIGVDALDQEAEDA